MDVSGLVLVLKRGWPLLVIAAGFALYYLLGLDRYFGIEALRANRVELAAWVEENGLWALAAFAVVYAIMVALSVPGAGVMTLAGGFMFGAPVATAVIVFAATAGATLLFLAARTSLGKPLRARAGPWLRTLESGFAENGISYLLLLRLMPIFPFWLVNLAPAFLHIPIRTYVIGTFFGIIPATFVYAWVGTGIGHVLDQGGEPDLHLIYSPNVLGPILGLIVLATIPIAYKRYRRSRDRARG